MVSGGSSFENNVSTAQWCSISKCVGYRDGGNGTSER